jgi:phosphate/sulfate permease
MSQDLRDLEQKLGDIESFAELPVEDRWEVRQSLFRVARSLAADPVLRRYQAERKALTESIEFVPLWVVIGVALALGVGTMIGYKRIVITVAEKIGKTHLTYAQGAVAEMVAAATIVAADVAHAPVSTTQVLSSGIAGTMAANRSGIQGGTCRKILLAWLFTLPGTIVLAGGLFAIGRWLAV